MKTPHDKINVLFVMIQMEMGGAERLIYNLASRLDRRRFNPSVAWLQGSKVLKEFSDLGIPLHYVPKGKGLDVSAMSGLRDIVRKNGIHVVNAHHFMPMVYSFYGCKIKSSVKLIYTEHSEWEIEQIPWIWKELGIYMLNRSDAVVGVNEKVSQAVQKTFRVRPSKTHTIRNGVDTEAAGAAFDRAGLKKKLGIRDGEKVIGAVANFRKNKNHIFLLKAFEALAESRKDVKLLLIGQGFKHDPENSEEDLRRFVNESGMSEKVLFLGYREDIPELLSVMDAFCLTSYKEGLPISLIEAMAAGLPVIGTEVEGIREVIEDGKNGLLVKPDDVEGLKKALSTLLLDRALRARLGEVSRATAERVYSFKNCLESYEDLFTSTVK